MSEIPEEAARHHQTGTVPVDIPQMVQLARRHGYIDETLFTAACKQTGWLYSYYPSYKSSLGGAPQIAAGLPWPEEDVYDDLEELYVLSPLHLAVASCFTNAVESCLHALLNYCCEIERANDVIDVTSNAFLIAATKGRPPKMLDDIWNVTKRALESKVSTDEEGRNNAVAEKQNRMFVCGAAGAAARGHVNVVKYLLNNCSFSPSDLDEVATMAFYNGENEVVHTLMTDVLNAFPYERYSVLLESGDGNSLMGEYFWRDFAMTGHIDTLRLFLHLRPGAVNRMSVCCHRNEEIETLLRLPVVARAPDVVDDLLQGLKAYPGLGEENDLDEDEEEELKETVNYAADTAAENGAREVLEMLVQKWGASPRPCRDVPAPSSIITYNKDAFDIVCPRYVRVREFWEDDGKGGKELIALGC